MRKGFWKQLSYEDKFDRKYACWAVNHNGWRKRKRLNILCWIVFLIQAFKQESCQTCAETIE